MGWRRSGISKLIGLWWSRYSWLINVTGAAHSLTCDRPTLSPYYFGNKPFLTPFPAKMVYRSALLWPQTLPLQSQFSVQSKRLSRLRTTHWRSLVNRLNSRNWFAINALSLIKLSGYPTWSQASILQSHAYWNWPAQSYHSRTWLVCFFIRV